MDKLREVSIVLIRGRNICSKGEISERRRSNAVKGGAVKNWNELKRSERRELKRVKEIERYKERSKRTVT